MSSWYVVVIVLAVEALSLAALVAGFFMCQCFHGI